LLPKIKRLEGSNRSLLGRVKSSVELVAKAVESKELLEEKYNVKQKKDATDPKQRVITRMLNEFQCEAEAAKIRAGL